MMAQHPHELVLQNRDTHRVTRSGFRGYVGLGMRKVLIGEVRDLVAAGGGMGPSGSEVLPILREAGEEEPAWPAPGDALGDLEKAVIELRVEIHALRDDRPMEPSGRLGTVKAWGLRHASLCGWASRMGMVGNPRHAGSPLLAEAIALRDELLRLAEASEPKARHRIA